MFFPSLLPDQGRCTGLLQLLQSLLHQLALLKQRFVPVEQLLRLDVDGDLVCGGHVAAVLMPTALAGFLDLPVEVLLRLILVYGKLRHLVGDDALLFLGVSPRFGELLAVLSDLLDRRVQIFEGFDVVAELTLGKVIRLHNVVGGRLDLVDQLRWDTDLGDGTLLS